MLKGLSPRKANGLDDLPARFIHESAESIAYPISYIINLSLETGVFTPQPLRLSGIVITRGGQSEIQLLLKN